MDGLSLGELDNDGIGVRVGVDDGCADGRLVGATDNVGLDDGNPDGPLEGVALLVIVGAVDGCGDEDGGGVVCPATVAGSNDKEDSKTAESRTWNATDSVTGRCRR